MWAGSFRTSKRKLRIKNFENVTESKKYKDMGALVMFGLVSVIAIVGVIYFNYQEKKGK